MNRPIDDSLLFFSQATLVGGRLGTTGGSADRMGRILKNLVGGDRNGDGWVTSEERVANAIRLGSKRSYPAETLWVAAAVDDVLALPSEFLRSELEPDR